MQEHERVLAQVPDAARVLLKPHLEDIEARLKPGAYLLTWTSLNIDGYLHHLHTVCLPPVNSYPGMHLYHELDSKLIHSASSHLGAGSMRYNHPADCVIYQSSLPLTVHHRGLA